MSDDLFRSPSPSAPNDPDAERRALVALPFDVPQPDRALGLLRLGGGPRNPAADRFAAHVAAAFEEMRHLIRRDEDGAAGR